VLLILQWRLQDVVQSVETTPNEAEATSLNLPSSLLCGNVKIYIYIYIYIYILQWLNFSFSLSFFFFFFFFFDLFTQGNEDGGLELVFDKKRTKQLIDLQRVHSQLLKKLFNVPFGVML
jgi:hypothetical protein